MARSVAVLAGLQVGEKPTSVCSYLLVAGSYLPENFYSKQEEKIWKGRS
jgi:hypothetical protein